MLLCLIYWHSSSKWYGAFEHEDIISACLCCPEKLKAHFCTGLNQLKSKRLNTIFDNYEGCTFTGILKNTKLKISQLQNKFIVFLPPLRDCGYTFFLILAGLFLSLLEMIPLTPANSAFYWIKMFARQICWWCPTNEMGNFINTSGRVSAQWKRCQIEIQKLQSTCNRNKTRNAY